MPWFSKTMVLRSYSFEIKSYTIPQFRKKMSGFKFIKFQKDCRNYDLLYPNTAQFLQNHISWQNFSVFRKLQKQFPSNQGVSVNSIRMSKFQCGWNQVNKFKNSCCLYFGPCMQSFCSCLLLVTLVSECQNVFAVYGSFSIAEVFADKLLSRYGYLILLNCFKCLFLNDYFLFVGTYARHEQQ